MAAQDSTTRHLIDSCSCEIPISQNDAVICNAPSDIECEEGFRCWQCFHEYGGTPLSSATPKPVIRVDFGLTMCDALDRLFSEPDAAEKTRWATHRQLSAADPLNGKGLL